MSAICKSNAQAAQPTMAECSVVKPEHPLSSLPLPLSSRFYMSFDFGACVCVCVCKHCAKPKTTKLFIRHVVPQPKTSAREREGKRETETRLIQTAAATTKFDYKNGQNTKQKQKPCVCVCVSVCVRVAFSAILRHVFHTLARSSGGQKQLNTTPWLPWIAAILIVVIVAVAAVAATVAVAAYIAATVADDDASANLFATLLPRPAEYFNKMFC